MRFTLQPAVTTMDQTQIVLSRYSFGKFGDLIDPGAAVVLPLQSKNVNICRHKFKDCMTKRGGGGAGSPHPPKSAPVI